MSEFAYTERDKKLFEELADEFVLDKKYALKYLRYCVDVIAECGFRDEQDSECVGDIIEDLTDMALRIQKEDWDYIRFSECPMSASGLNVAPMVEKEV